ncbi:MAG TPA: EVE domain-containing protein [Acidobacteriota bacterium]|nr:EVE domain-containing protein [Acidobacteriota bacterium]
MANYWLVKSEPSVYSIDDLQRDGRTHWDGVRNYQARNIMRDKMKKGDLVLFYHSNANPPGVVGMAKVVRTGYPDHTARDPQSNYYDPKSTEEDPRWYMVDIEFVEKFPRLVSLPEIKDHPQLQEMVLVRRSRLSVQPVRPHEFETIVSLARKS